MRDEYHEGHRHLKPVIICALETGGRLSEILGLRWDDVDFDQGILVFDQRNTKNGRQREIPMTPTLIETLKERSKSRFTGGDARSYVFTRHGKRLRDVRTAFGRARVGAGLGDDVCFHTLRHTWASWYAQRGGNMNLLQDLGGWSTQAMVQRYAHLSPGYRASAVPLMGRQAPSAGASDPEASRKLLGDPATGSAKG